MHSDFQLAQVNVARLRAPLDDPQIKDFVDGLAPLNALAESSPGFVWRLQDDAGNATGVAYDPDPLLIVNLSVWQDITSLRAYAHSGPHLEYLKRRREWFARLATPHVCLWWVEPGAYPSPTEAKARLRLLETAGVSAAAFTFARVYTPELTVLPASSRT